MIFTREDWAHLWTLTTPSHDAWGESSVIREATTSYAGYKPKMREAPNGDTKVCPTCGGSGKVNGGELIGYPHSSDVRTCHVCHGTGRVPNVDAAGVCGCCGGSGDRAVGLGENGLSLGACRACLGTGRTAGKRYLHVADKYNPPTWAKAYQDRAYAEACRVAEALRVPREFWPMPSVGALRVLEYPPGAGSAEHTDADLFTIVCWRETPEDLELTESQDWSDNRPEAWHLAKGRAISPGLHIGELGELVGLGPATPHRVPARPYTQRSIVYFAIPDHGAALPLHKHWKDPCHYCKLPNPPADGECGRSPMMRTVGEWLAERMKRSRYEASR